MIQPLKLISLSLFLLACIAAVNAWQPPQKPQKPALEDDSSVQTTFQYLSTKLRNGITPNLARRDARYGQNIPPGGHHLLNLDRRQNNTSTSTTSAPPNSSTTRPSTSSSSSLPSRTTSAPTTTSDTPTPSSSTMLSVTTLSDGSLSTFTSIVVITPTRTTGTTGRPSSTSQNPSLQGGAASATIGLKKQMLAMLGGAVAVAMAL